MRATDMHVCDDIEPEFEALLEQGLNGFNDLAVGYEDRKPLAVVFGEIPCSPEGTSRVFLSKAL